MVNNSYRKHKKRLQKKACKKYLSEEEKKQMGKKGLRKTSRFS